MHSVNIHGKFSTDPALMVVDPRGRCETRGCQERPVINSPELCADCAIEAGVGMTQATEPRPDVRGEGVVYFMLKGDLVKIGFSTNLRLRARHLRADRVLAYFAGDRRAERAAHQVFSEWHSHGEWFHATPECLAYIQRLTARAA